MDVKVTGCLISADGGGCLIKTIVDGLGWGVWIRYNFNLKNSF